MRHELGSSITYGFLVLLEATGLHPALLPVTLFNEVVLGIVREVQIHYQELETLAVTCGQNRYDGLPLTDLPDPLDSDFVGATRWLTCIRHGNAANIVKAQCMFLGLGQASSWLRSIELAKKMDCNTTSDFRSDRDATRSLLSCKNTHAVLQLFHYMAAKNAKANLSIAETSATIAKASKEDSAAMRTIASESKRDSSTMKTISLLGMIFLPGTFIEVSAPFLFSRIH